MSTDLLLYIQIQAKLYTSQIYIMYEDHDLLILSSG